MTPRTRSPHQDPAVSRAIDAIIAAPGDWRSTTLARLRAVILSADASMSERIQYGVTFASSKSGDFAAFVRYSEPG